MSDTYICLGQAQPAAGVLTTLYTVPTSTATTVSTLVVANITGTSGATDSFYVAISVGGSNITMAQYIYYQVPCLKQDTFCATLGITMAAGDTFRVQSDNGNLVFQAFGIQIT